MPTLWSCPRCRQTVTVGGPTMFPENCPRCRYPDDAPPGLKITDDDLEADVGEEQRRLAQAQAQAAEQPPAPLTEPDTSAVVRDALQLRVDRGWLAVCVREAIDTMVHREEHTELEYLLEPEFVHELTQLIAGTYEGDRWTLVCGCLAGTHGEQLEDIFAAHPERRSRSKTY
jgi:hypothetical protein